MVNEFGNNMCSLPPSKHMYLGCGLSSIERSSTLSDLVSLHMDNVISEFDLDEFLDFPRSAAQEHSLDSK